MDKLFNPQKTDEANENKLDEDFLFYLGFVSTFQKQITDKVDIQKIQGWMQKLVGEKFVGIDAKRKRNIFLSNLVIAMEEGKLNEPFSKAPAEVDINDTEQYFGLPKTAIHEPGWFDEVEEKPAVIDDENQENPGRTFIATRALPDGSGAFAYVGLSLAPEEPMWLGGGEGAFAAKLEEKYPEYMPPMSEMEQILAKRRDPRERQRVLTFYDVLLQNISDEIEKKVPMEQNDAINVLVNQLTQDLKDKEQFAELAKLSPEEQRANLLLILHERTIRRRRKIAKREELLDNIEAMMVANKSFFDESGIAEDRYEMPAHMWEQIIKKPPLKKHVDELENKYPYLIYMKFIQLLCDEKEQITLRMQRKHENIVSQMKKELRREGEALKKALGGDKKIFEQATKICKNVRTARQKQIDSENAAPKRPKGGITKKTAMYEEMRNALRDTQQSVEDEAAKGQQLTKQINALNAQTELYQQVTEDSIMRTEEANMAIMKNIKKLKTALNTHEARLQQIQVMQQHKARATGKSDMFIF